MMPAEARAERFTHQNLMGVHRPRQEESCIMWRVELVTKDVNRGYPLDVVLCA